MCQLKRLNTFSAKNIFGISTKILTSKVAHDTKQLKPFSNTLPSGILCLIKCQSIS